MTDPAAQAKFKTLSASLQSSPAWQTYAAASKACNASYTSGAFGAFKKGDTKGNAAAYVKYQACSKAAADKYKAAITADTKWVSTFREAQEYVNSVARAQTNGMTILKSACTSAADKNLLARIGAAAGLSTAATVIIGARVRGAAGLAAWKLL